MVSSGPMVRLAGGRGRGLLDLFHDLGGGLNGNVPVGSDIGS